MSRMLCQYVRQFVQKLVCRRPLEPIEESESATAHLNILGLVILGVGRSLGAGVYVLIGFIAKLVAGPSVITCFLVDSLSAVLFRLCYAEVGAQIPRLGSVHLHSFAIMGQLCGFVIGWNLILSLFVGTACVAKAWSIAFDSLTGNHISQALEGTFSLYMPSALATFPNFVTLGPLLLITAWALWVLEGLCLLALKGFFTEQLYFSDHFLVTKGREARNPQCCVPLSMVISIFICFLASSGVSVALPLTVSYYQTHHYNPWPQAFFHVGWAPAGYVMAVVFLCTLLYSLLGAMFVLSWLICAMADDGLLFRGLGWIHAGTHSPIMAILASGTLAAIMALPFELRDIVEFMLIGIMLAYTLVAFSVLVLSTIPTWKSGQIVYGCAFMLVLLLSILSLIPAQGPSQVFSGDPGLTTVAVLLLLLITGVTVIIWRQPQDPSPLHFKVPALPVLPLVSIFVNIYLMMQITSWAWVQFDIWNAIGFVIYFGYGI